MAAYDAELVPYDHTDLEGLVGDIESCIERLLDSLEIPALNDDDARPSDS